jgi:hypothetical protein
MSDASWQELEQAGITSVTRTNWRQRQYMIVSADDGHCRPVPGHERILACPDFYLTTQSAAQALKLIDHTIAVSGTIDLWAHTEEVTSPNQIAAWGEVAGYAARQRDEGKLWIAPLAEIADWQQARRELRVESSELRVAGAETPLKFTITNDGSHGLNGITVQLPFDVGRFTVDGKELKTQNSKLKTLTLDLRAGQTVEVQAWSA